MEVFIWGLNTMAADSLDASPVKHMEEMHFITGCCSILESSFNHIFQSIVECTAAYVGPDSG